MAGKTVQTVGVKYTIENANQFLNQLNQLQKRIGDSGQKLTKAQEGTVRSMNKAAQAAFNSYTQSLKVEQQALKLKEAEIRANAALEKSANSLAAANIRAASAAARGAAGGGLGGAFGGLSGLAGGVSGAVGMVSSLFRGVGGVVSSVTSIFSRMAGVVGGVVTGAFRLLTAPIDIVFRGLSSISNLFTGHLSLGGVAFAGVLYQIANGLRNVATEVLDAASAFQRLEIQFQSLSARDISHEMGISVADAMGLASMRAEELANWVQEIAVSTPFTVRSISEAVAFANAMGLSVTNAQRLTVATGNFTSAMGLTEEHLQRIIYNFGQILDQGKLTGREFRDLAISFVPVNDILAGMAEEAGMTTEEFKKLAFDGGIPVMDFFEAFINMANTDFPDAMERMSRTWQGVRNNIKDFIEVVIGVDVIKPVLDKITGILADTLKKLMSDETRTIARRIGLSLTVAFDTVYASLNRLIKAFSGLGDALGIAKFQFSDIVDFIIRSGAYISGFVDMISSFVNQIAVFFRTHYDEIMAIKDRIVDTLSSIVTGAASFGYNLIVQYAGGIVRAINSVLRTVMSALSGFLSAWLMPHSPPMIAPDIDQWGADTFTEYLRGFSMANFDVLDGIQDLLKSSLGALVNLGMLSEVTAAESMYQISLDLITAIDQFKETGELSALVMEELGSLAGGFGEELVILYEREMALMSAMEAAEDAQTRLNDAMLAAKTSRGIVHGLVKEYNALLRGGASRESLASKLLEINKEEAKMSAAEKQAAIARKDKELADAQVDILEQQVKLQEKLIQQMVELASLFKDIADARERAASAGGGDGGAGDVGGIQWPEEEKVVKGELGKGSKVTEAMEIIGELNNMLADAQARFAAFRDNVIAIVGPIWETITGIWNTGESSPTQNARTITETMTRMATNIGASLRRMSVTALDTLGTALGQLSEWWNINGEAVLTNFDNLARGLEGVAMAIQVISDVLNERFLAAWNAFLWASGVISQMTAGASFGEATAANQVFWDAMMANSPGAGTATPGAAGESLVTGETFGVGASFGAEVTPSITSAYEEIGRVAGAALKVGLKEVLVNDTSYFVPDVAAGAMAVAMAMGDIYGGSLVETGVRTRVEPVLSRATRDAAVAATLQNQQAYTENGVALGTAMGEGMSTGMTPEGTTWWEEILASFQFIVDGIKGFFGIESPSTMFAGIGENLVVGLKDGIVDAANALIDEILAPFLWLVDQIMSALGESSPSDITAMMGINLMKGLANGISAGTGLAVSAAGAAAGSVLGAVGAGRIVSGGMVSAPPVTQSSTVNFGDVTINNGMDWAVFKAQVQRAILEDV